MPPRISRRRVFFSFHYDRDNWRTSQVRNIGAIHGSKPLSANAWEEVKRRGKAAIREWIDARIDRGSCVVVLVGSETADREWVRYDIERAWVEGKGLVGIYIHNLLDRDGEQSRKGRNPFEIDVGGVRPSNHVKVRDPRTKALAPASPSVPRPPGHAEADAGLGEDEAGVLGVLAQLAAKLAHDRAHGAHVAGALPAPAPLQQVLVGQHPPGVDRKPGEQPALRRGQVHRPASVTRRSA